MCFVIAMFEKPSHSDRITANEQRASLSNLPFEGDNVCLPTQNVIIEMRNGWQNGWHKVRVVLFNLALQNQLIEQQNLAGQAQNRKISCEDERCGSSGKLASSFHIWASSHQKSASAGMPKLVKTAVEKCLRT